MHDFPASPSFFFTSDAPTFLPKSCDDRFRFIRLPPPVARTLANYSPCFLRVFLKMDTRFKHFFPPCFSCSLRTSQECTTLTFFFGVFLFPVEVLVSYNIFSILVRFRLCPIFLLPPAALSEFLCFLPPKALLSPP